METSVNNKCKAFTSLEQSKKLAEILPIDSADMYYPYNGIETYPEIKNGLETETALPCWSLTALMNAYQDNIVMYKQQENNKWHISTKYLGTYVTSDNPIDACVEMIIKLYEMNML